MVGTERALDEDDDPLVRFAADLRRLREKAGHPPYRKLSRHAHYSAAALSDAASGRKLPSLSVTLAYVTACGGDPEAWERRWHALAADLAVAKAAGEPAEHDMESAPYVGLAAFRTADAGKFFGRDRLVAQLCARVAERRFVIVVGASGSGKSSLLQAGLLHHAQTHGLRGTADGPRLVMAPGPRPLEECAARLAALAGTAASPLHAALRDDPRSLHLTALQALVDKPSGPNSWWWWTSSRRCSPSAPTRMSEPSSSRCWPRPRTPPTAARESCWGCAPISTPTAPSTRYWSTHCATPRSWSDR
ncbi:hypothetical protein Psuf_066540 [Phytohabitans suffuscus]|uniref:HTH cro/C1-type domain-containing protein n=1 Tax=Phytohabitans suffuscus TaxID=624315 RepID=A0A6F8YU28_9ACTN|nr:hypothetical protein Psuf_066540 [Phytohabitans suffuscus]